MIEIAELSGFKKADVEGVKQFLSKRFDKFRVAYGRRIENFMRQCVFFGTTNEISFLKDYTGNRRFWPVECSGKGNDKFHEIDVDQIWAEAKHLWDQGEQIYLGKEMESAALDVQNYHTEAEERIGLVENFLEMPLPENWDKMPLLTRRAYIKDSNEIAEYGVNIRGSICVAELWCELFEQDLSKMTSVNTKYIHQMLAKIEGWSRSNSVRTFSIYGRQKAYVRVDPVMESMKELI